MTSTLGPAQDKSQPKAVSSDTEKRTAAAPSALASAPLTARERFICAARGRRVDRPPLWLMRQAGRVLPEYRALKTRHSFVELVQTPELAAEVTLQPIRRFGFDAAIFFSDILVVPEAMGQAYQFRDTLGIKMEFALTEPGAIDRLDPNCVADRLAYVTETLRLVRAELAGKTALIGFAGSPWTLANFMMEGGTAKEYLRAKALFYTDPPAFYRLQEKLTNAVITFLQMQIDAGVDAVQIFDSLGGILSADAYASASGAWIQRIVEALGSRVPVIVFGKGVHGNWHTLARTGADVLSVDWTVSLPHVKSLLPEAIGLQGNLDPAVLTTDPAIVQSETQRLLESMRGISGFIFNLGHGVPPASKIENIETLVQTVQQFS
ncbi:MAG: uroporphyrinogen decarboxylase [Verrucomicrobiota bacterium]